MKNPSFAKRFAAGQPVCTPAEGGRTRRYNDRGFFFFCFFFSLPSRGKDIRGGDDGLSPAQTGEAVPRGVEPTSAAEEAPGALLLGLHRGLIGAVSSSLECRPDFAASGAARPRRGSLRAFHGGTVMRWRSRPSALDLDRDQREHAVRPVTVPSRNRRRKSDDDTFPFDYTSRRSGPKAGTSRAATSRLG